MSVEEEAQDTKDKIKKSKSLVEITNSFLDFLKAQDGKEVDLTIIEKNLNISKRRLYDVTNVFAGIGVIERAGKSKVKWIGKETIELAQEDDDNEEEEMTIQQLIEYEKDLDAKTEEISGLLSVFYGSTDFQKFAYMTYKDLINTVKPRPEMAQYVLTGPSDLTIEFGDNYNTLIGSTKLGNVSIVQLNGKSD